MGESDTHAPPWFLIGHYLISLNRVKMTSHKCYVNCSLKLVLIIPLIFLLNCSPGDITGADHVKNLSDTTNLYYKLLMWKYYDKATRFIDPEMAKQYEEFVDRNEKDLNITNYEIKEVVMIDGGGGETKDGDPKSSIVRVTFTYYKYPSVSEKTKTLEDTWIRLDKRWYISSEFEEGTFD